MPDPICNNHTLSQSFPLRLLPRHKLIQNAHDPLQALQPRIQLLAHPGLIIPQLRVKVLPIRRRAHRGAENRLHDERMMLLQRPTVRVSE